MITQINTFPSASEFDRAYTYTFGWAHDYHVTNCGKRYDGVYNDKTLYAMLERAVNDYDANGDESVYEMIRGILSTVGINWD